jgi:hypothetical protein
MLISSPLILLLGSTAAVVAEVTPKSYTKFQSIGLSMNTGPDNAIDIEATFSNCEYITPEDCPTDWVALGAFDGVCEACIVINEQCGSLGLDSSNSTKCYLGKSDTEEDVNGRISIMQQAVEKAYEVASQDEDTLKIFIAPEFFLRGADGAYPVDDIDNPGKEGEYNAIAHISEALEEIIQQERFSDWLFLFGTIVAFKETTLETQKEEEGTISVQL